MSFSKWLRSSKPGYGVVLVLMVLASSLLLASSFKFTRGNSLNNQTTALQNNTAATQLANYGLEAFKSDIVTQLKAGTSVTTSYRYPSSGTNSISVPNDPANLSGASSTVGTYFGTVSQVRGNYYLLSVTAVAGTSTVTKNSLMDITVAKEDVRFIGKNVSDDMGYSVSGTGDVNGDGVDDLVMGSPYADGGGADAGEAYLVLGRTNAFWRNLTDASGDFDMDSMSDANLTVRLIGRDTSDGAGYSVSGAGDVNNDGYDDIIVGARNADPAAGGVDSGEAYLVLGRSTSAWASLTDASGNFDLANSSDANLMVRFIGRKTGERMGTSVAGVGDVNNDGYDDVMMGSPSSDGGGANSGETYLILGRSTANWASLTDASGDFNLDNMSDANLTVLFFGRNMNENLVTVSGAGDVNNDGYDDIIMSADYADGGGANSGEAYLILGRSTANWAILTDASGDFNLDNTSDGNTTVRFIGRAIGDELFSVSGAGDVNNDGYDDIIMSADYADGGGLSSGEAYLILGRSTASWASLTDAIGDFSLTNMSDVNSTVRFIGRNVGDRVYSVSGAGDVNNDGYDDLVLGAFAADGGDVDAGEAYLILGRSTSAWINTLSDASGDFNLDNTSDANLTVRFLGRNTGDRMSLFSTFNAGDVNYDGYNDLIIGAYLADSGGADSGEVYLITGRNTVNWASLTDASGDFNLDNI